jgi:hypothetical protein
MEKNGKALRFQRQSSNQQARCTVSEIPRQNPRSDPGTESMAMPRNDELYTHAVVRENNQPVEHANTPGQPKPRNRELKSQKTDVEPRTRMTEKKVVPRKGKTAM